MKTLSITEIFGRLPSGLRAEELRKIGPRMLVAPTRCSSGLDQLCQQVTGRRVGRDGGRGRGGGLRARTMPPSVDSASAVRMGPADGSKLGCGGAPAAQGGWSPSPHPRLALRRL